MTEHFVVTKSDKFVSDITNGRVKFTGKLEHAWIMDEAFATAVIEAAGPDYVKRDLKELSSEVWRPFRRLVNREFSGHIR